MIKCLKIAQDVIEQLLSSLFMLILREAFKKKKTQKVEKFQLRGGVNFFDFSTFISLFVNNFLLVLNSFSNSINLISLLFTPDSS